MPDNILDENTKSVRFKKPVTLKVDKMAWELLCDELQRKATIGTFIILAVGIVVSLISGFLLGSVGSLVLLACFGFAIFLNMGVRKRFKLLRELSDHTFIISSSQIIEEHDDEKKIIPFNKIKDIEFHNWGVELDTKKNRKPSEKDTSGLIKIPRMVNDYGRVLATFEHLEKQ